MKKAMMFPIHKKWVDRIFNGRKKFEFRNKLPKHLAPGMKIYFYETLGKMKQGIIPVSENNPMPRYWCSYEGQGKVIGEAIVGKMYNLKNAKYPKKIYDITGFSSVSLIANGFKWHDFAIEITNVIKYDGLWLGDKLTDEDFYDDITENYHDMLVHAPTEPIDKSKFYSWNKLIQLVKVEASGFDKKITIKRCEKILDGHYDLYKHAEITTNETKECKITAPPQAPIYIVEKELN